MRELGGAWIRCVVVGLGASFALACGGGDDGGGDSNEKDCGTASDPDPFVIANVEPAVGASVPNTGIVHRFKIVGTLYVDTLQTLLVAAHTAGTPTGNPMWTITNDGDGALYTSSPITWTTAPAHVEVDFAGGYAAPDGCVFAFPSPMFSYELTAP